MTTTHSPSSGCPCRGHRSVWASHESDGAVWQRPLLAHLLDIPGYTRRVHVVKIRRVGNSNVVSVPKEFEDRGYGAGTSVVVEEAPGGGLRVIPVSQLSGLISDLIASPEVQGRDKSQRRTA